MNFDASHFTLIIVALITGILSPITLQVVQYFFKKKTSNIKHSLSKNNDIKKDEHIIEKLKKLKETYACDRVWIAEFHNGAKTYSGKSFQKFSTTYEIVGQGIANMATNTQNMPTSIFSLFFKKLVETGHYYIKDIKESNDPTTFAMQSFWENRGVSSFICFSIIDIKGNFVGFLCMDGVINDILFKEDTIQKIALETSILAGYLEG